jgi:L-asparaginase
VAKRILLLATKDTIAYSHHAGRPTIATGANLLDTIPQDHLTADVTTEDLLTESSWDMSPATMLAIARRARGAILDDGFDGVVVAHGTDTLEDTAFLTDLLAGPATEHAGIVFTAATRRLDDLSTDGPRNLASSITAAADPGLHDAGVVACLNDELHAARWVTHVDATNVAAFSSHPYPALGRVTGGHVEPIAAPPPRPPQAHGEPESDVALIKTYPGIGPAPLHAAIDAGARGVVLEGTGTGNVPVDLFAAISDLIQWDIPVVIASRCRTRPAALVDQPPGSGLASGLGAIGARGLHPAKARTALMVALGGGGVDAARRWFDTL